MPTISEFYGIRIWMYYDESCGHQLAHFHAKYNKYDVSISLDGKVLAGYMPPKKMNLLNKWFNMHIKELRENWELMRNGEEFKTIEPLQ
jgi:hypothetical protein